MVITFVCSSGSRTKDVWQFLDKVSQADVAMMFAEMEHISLKKMLSFCSERVPIYVHPSFIMALKLKFPKDIRGLSRDGQVTRELGTNSLRHSVGVLTTEDFRTVVDPE